MSLNILHVVRKNLSLVILLIILVFFYAVLYKIYIPRVNAFGCFDDCFNFLGGYFIANGKHIYSDFFFNHQPIPAFLSYFIQTITNPINIFDLVLQHRQFVMLFGLLFNALLIIRFRFAAFLFAVVFELSKFYVFGDRFLAEALIVYPTVYLTGLALLKASNKKPASPAGGLYTIDYFLIPILVWFIIFSREPYAPLALFLFTILMLGKFKKIKKISVAIFTILSIATLFYIFNLREYFFNVVTFNYVAVLPSDLNVNMVGPKSLQIFFYPFYIFFYGEWNIFKQLLIGLDIVFLSSIFLLMKGQKFKFILLIFLILGFANLRVVLPGSLFYESFHLIVWYALFIFSTSFVSFNYSNNKHLKMFALLVLALFLVSFISSKSYFANEKIDRHTEFIGNFGQILQIGEVVKALSNKNDTLFLDRSDDLIYWQADKLSPYKYTWYTSQMNHFKKYTDARIEMFRKNPPDFYKEFGSCPKKNDLPDASLPAFVKDKYIRLYDLDSPSCLFVKKSKIGQISEIQWKKAKEFLYHLP